MAPPRFPWWVVAVVLSLLAARGSMVDAAVATPAPAPTAALSDNDFTLVAFRNPYLVPPTSVDIILTGSVGFIQPLSKACAGPAWANSIQPVGDATPFLAGMLQSVSLTSDKLATITFQGNLTFWVSSTADYRLIIPTTCLVSTNFTLDPIPFTIENGKRSSLGRIFSFFYLTAGSVAVFATLGGSVVALSTPQLVAAVTSCGCGPIETQDEYEVLRWMLVPIEAPVFGLGRWYHDYDTDFTMLVFGMVIAGVIMGLDAFHAILRCVLTNQYWPFLKKTIATADKDPAGSHHYRYGSLREEAEDDRATWPGRTWLPGYMLFCWAISLSIGIMRYAMRVLMTFSTNGVLFIAFVGCFGCCFALPVMTLVITRHRQMKYHTYQASKGRIPVWAQPSGVWGPNFYRLSFGFLFEDFRLGFKGFGAAILLLNVIITLPMGSTPTTLLACRNVLWVITFASWAFTALLYGLRPFRSKFHNNGNIMNYCLMSVFITFFLVRSGYYYDQPPDHWSENAIFFSGMVHAASSLVVSVGHVGAAYWEAYDRLAIKNTNGELGATATVTAIRPEVQFAAERSAAGRRALELPTSNDAKYMGTREMYLEMIAHFAQHPVDEDEQEIINLEAGGEVNQQTLAEYLMQDYDALPPQTKDEMILWERLASEVRRRNNAVRLEPMVVHPDLVPTLQSTIEFEHRDKPPVNWRFL